MNLLALCALLLWPTIELLRQLSAWRALREMPQRHAIENNEKKTSDATRLLDGIDILQAIRSGDATLADNLAHSLHVLAARGARLHWLIDADDYIAAEIAQGLLDAHPLLCRQVSISFHPPCPADTNPKLFKLNHALDACRGDVLVVLDDDARLPATTLTALIDAIHPPSSRVTDAVHAPIIATALPVYLLPTHFASRLLATFVNDNAALTYLPPRNHKHTPTINGMAYVLRRDTLIEIGGFASQLHHLTDDLAMAQALLTAGGRIDQRSEPVWMRTELTSLRAYWRQMHRWMLFAILLLRTQTITMRIRIVLTQGLPTLLPTLSTIALLATMSLLSAVLFSVGLLAHVLGRRALRTACAGRYLPAQSASSQGEKFDVSKAPSLASSLALSLIIALLQPAHLVLAWLYPLIIWRGRRYRVYRNDRFRELA